MPVSEMQFNKVSRLASQLSIESAKLDRQIMDEYGFHYSDKDMDEIIDCLDYGTSTLSFNSFKRLMEKEKHDA